MVPLPHGWGRQVLGEKHPATTPLAHPRFGGGWRASARRKGASFLRPTACGAGEGHEVARGGFADGTLPQEAIKMAPQYFQRAPPSFTIFHSPFTIFKWPLPPLPWSPSPCKQGEASIEVEAWSPFPMDGAGKFKEKKASRYYAYLPTPVFGGGWRASARRKGAAI